MKITTEEQLFSENKHSQLMLTIYDNHTATIYQLQTLRNHRNKGNAVNLLDKTIKQIKKEGVSFVKVKIYPLDEAHGGLDRKGLVGLFSRYGFLNLSKYSMLLELY